MKKLFGVMILIGSLSLQALPPQQEPMLLKGLIQKANFMPPITPGDKRVVSELTLEVLSSGCTKPSDFKVQISDTRSGQFLEIIRMQPDVCEMVEHRKVIKLITRDLRLATENPIVLRNPVFSVEQVAH